MNKTLGEAVNKTFDIRDAAPTDAPFIARNILAGMGHDVFSDAALEQEMDFGQRAVTLREAVAAFVPLCAAPDTLYSYRRTRISTVDGVPTGSLTAYPGSEYLQLKERTCGEWGRTLGVQPSVSQEPECLPGEFYLDTLAVSPEWRGLRFEYGGMTGRTGHLLMLDALEKARREGLGAVTLIVDSDKPRLAEYYSGTGFRPYGRMSFFGHPYTRMKAVL